MAQFIGVLGLLLCETPVLPFNVTRYVTVLKQTKYNTQRNDSRFGMNKNIFIYFL